MLGQPTRRLAGSYNPHVMPVLRVPLAPFLEAVEVASAILRRKRQAKAVFSFRNGLLTIAIAQSACDVPADGEWPGVAKTPALFLLRVVNPPPKADPVTITLNDGRLSIERVSTACEWLPEGSKSPRLASNTQKRRHVGTVHPAETAPAPVEAAVVMRPPITLGTASATLDRVADRAAGRVLHEALRCAAVTSAVERAAEQLADGAEYKDVREGVRRVFRVEVFKRRIEKDLVRQAACTAAKLQNSSSDTQPEGSGLNIVDEDLAAADEFDAERIVRIRELQARSNRSDQESEELSSLLDDRDHDARELGAIGTLLEVLDRHGVSISTNPDELPDEIKRSIFDELRDDPFLN